MKFTNKPSITPPPPVFQRNRLILPPFFRNLYRKPGRLSAAMLLIGMFLASPAKSQMTTYVTTSPAPGYNVGDKDFTKNHMLIDLGNGEYINVMAAYEEDAGPPVNYWFPAIYRNTAQLSCDRFQENPYDMADVTLNLISSNDFQIDILENTVITYQHLDNTVLETSECPSWPNPEARSDKREIYDITIARDGQGNVLHLRQNDVTAQEFTDNIRIFDLTGRQRYSGPVNRNEITLEGWPAGIYLAGIYRDNKLIQYEKILVE
jgi:hypothetical protein